MPVMVLEGPGPGPPLSASGASSSVGVGEPLPCLPRPSPGGAMDFRQPAFPRAGSPAPVPPWGPEGLVFLSSCSWFCYPHLSPSSLLHADRTQHGWGCGSRSPAAMLAPAPHLLPAVAPGTRGSLWLSSVPTALLPSLQAALGRLRTGLKPRGLACFLKFPFLLGGFCLRGPGGGESGHSQGCPGGCVGWGVVGARGPKGEHRNPPPQDALSSLPPAGICLLPAPRQSSLSCSQLSPAVPPALVGSSLCPGELAAWVQTVPPVACGPALGLPCPHSRMASQ